MSHSMESFSRSIKILHAACPSSSAFCLLSRKVKTAFLDKYFRKPNCCNIGFVFPQEIE